MDSIPVEVRVLLSKKIPPGITEVTFGRYSLRAIPSSGDEGGDAILQFVDNYSHPEGGGSHPEEEAAHVCRLLALSCNARFQKRGLRIANVDISSSREHAQYPQFLGALETRNLASDVQCALSLEDDLARQFLRASHTYSFALEFIPSDVTFAFFLLVTSIECLSSQSKIVSNDQWHPDKKKAERFVAFIDTYLPVEHRGADEIDSGLFRELLKTIYYAHRSAFVHGGREVSAASLFADRAASSYFKHEVDGKEIRTPGVGWFAGVVRHALLGYLRAPRSCVPDPSRLARLSFEKAALRLKAKRDVQKGTVVTFDDIEFR